jgi:hypothetical protein
MTRLSLTRRAFLPVTASILAALAVAAAQAAVPVLGEQSPPLMVGPGIARITASTVVKVDLLLQPGAVIEVAAGQTLTLLGGLIAPIGQIFAGPGRVDLNRCRIARAHPEWWGAAPGDSNRDSLPALRACLRAHPVMHLLAADYFLSDMLIVDRAFCTITGSVFRGTQAGDGTRLIVTNGAADVMRIWPEASPGGVNAFLQNIAVCGLALCRSVVPDTAGGHMPAGLRAQFLLFADFREISAPEHGASFVARGLVRSTLTDCVAFRSMSGAQAGQLWRCFPFDGSRDIGLAGGNASIFLRSCNATIGGAPALADAAGLQIEGAFASTFVTEFETSGVPTGIRIDGKTALIGGRARHGNIDLHLVLPVIDKCASVRIDILDTSSEALIDVIDPYIAVAPGAAAALRFQDMRGLATVTGGQLAGAVDLTSGGRAVGLSASTSGGLQVSGFKMLEHARPASLAGCSGFALRLAIANPSSRPCASGIILRDCESGTADILLSGQNSAFASGVRVEGSAKRLRIDATTISASAVGDAGKRVMLEDKPLVVPSRVGDLVVVGV